MSIWAMQFYLSRKWSLLPTLDINLFMFQTLNIILSLRSSLLNATFTKKQGVTKPQWQKKQKNKSVGRKHKE